MSLYLLIGHHLCSAAATCTLLHEQGVVSVRLGRRNRCSIAALIAAILLWFELPNLMDSHYARVGLPINASHYDIVSRHARIKMEFQKNGPPEDIAEMKRAFEVLTNEEYRKAYDRFGDLESELIDHSNLAMVATALAFAYHILSCIMSAVIYKRGSMNLTRYGMFLYSGIAFAMEIESRFVASSTLFKSVFYLNKLLPFQRILLMRRIAPVLALILNIISVNMYTDKEMLTLELWQSAVITNRVIIEKMTDVIDATRYLKYMVASSPSFMQASSSSNEQHKASASGDVNIDDISDILGSMDDSQRQKVVNLLTAVRVKEESKRKTEGWLSMLKGPATYLALFLAVRYLFS